MNILKKLAVGAVAALVVIGSKGTSKKPSTDKSTAKTATTAKTAKTAKAKKPAAAKKPRKKPAAKRAARS